MKKSAVHFVAGGLCVSMAFIPLMVLLSFRGIVAPVLGLFWVFIWCHKFETFENWAYRIAEKLREEAKG